MDLINKIDKTLLYGKNIIRILGTSSEPLFVAKDICNILGLTNITEALRIIPEKWKSSELIKTSGGSQNMILINEAGLYKLIIRSNKSKAEKFQEWICEDVLPSIRKTGEYNIKQLQKELEDTKEELKGKEVKVIEEQNQTIKLKKILKRIQTKFSQRHKFSSDSCIYLVQDPENIYHKFKIGSADDLNERLKNERTMIPNLKVKMVMYTPYYKMFEKIVKIKYADRLDGQSEWLFIELDEIMDGLEEINKVTGFNSRIETDLHKYNLDEKKTGNIIDKPKYVPEFYGVLSDKFVHILPSYLSLGDYLRKNSDAPSNTRLCAAWCKDYKPISLFQKNIQTYSNYCNECVNLADMANKKIQDGIYTYEEVREDPDIIPLEKNQKICNKCGEIKNKYMDFIEKRNACRQCRNKLKSINGDTFEKSL